MKTLSCPKWLLRCRRSNKSIADSPSYDLVMATQFPAPPGSSGGNPGPTDHGCTPSERTSSSTGLPSRIRKRLSQESAWLRARHSLFGVSIKPPSLSSGPKTSSDLRHSLMDEADYDSDAQHIASPRRRVDTIYDTPRGSLQTPLSPCSDKDVEDVSLSESRSLASNCRAIGVGDETRYVPEDNAPVYQPNAPYRPPCIATPRNPKECFQRRVGLQPISAMQLHGPRSQAPKAKIHESQLPSLQENDPTATLSETVAENPPSDRTLSPPIPSTTTSAVVPDRYIQISVRKTRQRRPTQRLHDPSVHLDTMNIPGALALSSPSSYSSSQYEHDDNDTNDDGTSDGKLYEESHSDVPSDEPTWGSDTLDVGGTRDISSSSSNHRSFSSAPSTSQFERRALSHLYTSVPTFKDHRAGSPLLPLDRFNAGEDNTVSSINQDNRANSALGQYKRVSSGVPSTRRVSVGWMTEGRRLGYGYDLVPTDEKAQESPCSSVACISGSTSPTPVGLDYTDDSDDSDSSTKRKGVKSLKIRKSISSIFSSGNRHGSSKNPGESATTSLWEKFRARKKRQSGAGSIESSMRAQSSDGGGPPAFNNAHDPEKKADVPVRSFRCYFSKPRTLRHAMNVWARRRAVSENTEAQAEERKQSRCASTGILRGKDLQDMDASQAREGKANGPVLASTEKRLSSTPEKRKHHIPTLIFLDGLDIQAQLDQIAMADDQTDTGKPHMRMPSIPELNRPSRGLR